METAADKIIRLFLLLLLAPLLAPAQEAVRSNTDGVHQFLTVQLASGTFAVHDIPPQSADPAPAILLLFTDKGGWTLWDDRVGGHLAKLGYYVLGIDTPLYASAKGGDYKPDDFAADLERIVEAAPDAFVAKGCPIFLVGRGLGAMAALGGAAVPPPPPRLAGVIVTDVLPRGRYGYHLRDRVPFLSPGGDGTFSAAEAAANLGALPVVHLHPDDGKFDETAWLASVHGPKRQIDYVRGLKNFGVATPPFLRALDASLAWVLSCRTLTKELDKNLPMPAAP